MAGFSRGIADFVNGALSGVQLRQKWDDRKRQQKLDDEQRQWEREDRATAAEDRKRKIAAEDEDAAWVREDRQHTRAKRGIEEAARKKAQAIADADQATLADAFETAQKTYEQEANAAAKESVPLSATMPDTTAQPLPGGALEKALQQKPEERPAQKPALGIVPERRQKDDAATAAPQLAPEPAPAKPAPVDPSAPMVEAQPPAQQQASLLSKINPFGAANAQEIPSRDVVAGMDAQREAQNVPGAGIGDYAASLAAPVKRAAQGVAGYVRQRAGQVEDAAAQAVLPESMRAPASPASEAPVVDTRTPAAPAPAPAAPVSQDPMQQAIALSSPAGTVARPGPAAPAVSRAAAPAAPAAPAALATAAPEAVPPATAPAAIPAAPGGAAAAPAPAQAATPSLAAAADTAPRQMVDTNGMRRPNGVAGAVQPQQEAPPSERQVKARTFLQIYRAEGIPKVVEHYLKQGRIDEAEKFDKWARSEDTKEGQMAWAQGVHAYMVGDDEGFLDHMVDSYNADGYYDDGMEIVRKGTGFTRDPNGKVSGGQIVFRNKRTGKSYTQAFDDTTDLWELGMRLAPENVYDAGIADLKAAREFEQKQAEADLKQQRDLELEAVKAGAKGKSPEEEINDVWDRMSKEDTYGNGFNALPEAEKQKAVLERIQAVKAMALGRVPVTRSQIPVAAVDF